jgi:hypothetical protein
MDIAGKAEGVSKAVLGVAVGIGVADAILTGIDSGNVWRGAFRGVSNIASLAIGCEVAKGVTAVGTSIVVALSSGTLTVPGVIASSVAGSVLGGLVTTGMTVVFRKAEDALFGKMNDVKK